ncbi:SseB family protein [Pararhodobacter sp. SW119]|uniref:SseB family protein n=1 Tax=Pararhodobacter sp. SW119 TaxID=2780075 RepID=UPI001AE0AB8D|nr:SseB family protein [Pararhodobacter sp. SW119]
MPETSPLDAALRRMRVRPDDSAFRLAFHSELISSELFVLLTEEAQGDRLSPRVFDVDDGRAVLVFDSESRLASFAGHATAYAALPGRVLVAMLAQEDSGLSMIVNADSTYAELLPPEVVNWLAETLSLPAPEELEALPEAFQPIALSDAALSHLIPALERRLSRLPGLKIAVLAGVIWQGGMRGHLLALDGVAAPVRAALARAVAEALELSGLERGSLDVVFPSSSMMRQIQKVGRTLAPRSYVVPEPADGVNVGLEPGRPPRLK